MSVVDRHQFEMLCKRCDVYVGFGAMGVVNQPTGKTQQWLASHCWVCGRSAWDIAGAQRPMPDVVVVELGPRACDSEGHRPFLIRRDGQQCEVWAKDEAEVRAIVADKGDEFDWTPIPCATPSVASAIEIIQECRRSHVRWASWQDERGAGWATEVEGEAIGGPDFHREWVAKYDQVLEVLRAVDA